MKDFCVFVEKIPNANNKDGGTKKHQPHVVVVFAGFDQDKNEGYLNPKRLKDFCVFVEKIPNANSKYGGTKKYQPHVWPKRQTM